MDTNQPMNAVPLEEAALDAEELARACSVQMTWVVERVQSGLLAAPDLRFRSQQLLRARRLATLERNFDADPELAALAVDLIEEVESLRRRLRALGDWRG